jgi:hypothetical protein
VFQSAPASENTDSQYGDTSGLVAALNNLTVNGGWVINSGASAHMSSDNDTLSSTRVLSTPHYVTVSNGASIPVTISGHAFLHTPSGYSFILNDVLRVPKLVCNLLSDHKFTRDNFCSIEFDPFSFSVKDLRMKTVIIRCNSFVDLYTMPPPTKANKVFAFLSTIVAAKVWYRRLGHPGRDTTTSRQRMLAIPLDKFSSNLCHACQIGKHVRLPFSTSTCVIKVAFDLIHCDL